MNVPEVIKIGGHIYTVLLVDGEELNGDCGEMNATRSIIRIRKDMPQSQIEETLLHEVLHAINSGLSEETVGFLSSAIYQVLKDNNLI